MKVCLTATLALAIACAASSAAAQQDPASARALLTIANEDCVSVDADGEPWLECGIQDFDMTDDASRILTVSAGGMVQLWDREGHELRRLAWPDQPGGASGYPDARAAIIGPYGVAVIHQNQIVVLDLASGKILAQRVSDAMLIDEIAQFGGRALVGFRAWDWHGVYAAELLLPGGELKKLADLDDLRRKGPDYWIGGKAAPFTLHRAGPLPDVMLERSCMPIDARFCMWRDIPGSQLHVLDIARAAWSSFDVGMLTGYDSVDVVPAGSALFAIICGRGRGPYPSPRPCTVRDLERKRDIYRFDATQVRAAGDVGPQGAPELRLLVSYGDRDDLRRVSRDGSAHTLDASGKAGLVAPGGVLVPAAEPDTSFLLDRNGRKMARLPFAPRTCGYVWGRACRISSNGRRWLVSSMVPTDTTDDRHQLTLYALP
jgi:hypothetical protein